jgi:mRNA interferase HigB
LGIAYILSVRIISRKKLKDFWEHSNHKDAEQPLKAWFAEAKAAKWKSPNDLKIQYKNASFVGNNKIVFNIKGNSYRLIVAIKYEFSIIYIRFIGTHEQYDRINAKEI